MASCEGGGSILTSLPSPSSSSSTEAATTQVLVSCQALVQVSLQSTGVMIVIVNAVLHVVL